MPVIFPPIESASPEGLLAIGGNLDEQTLLTAYKQGIFPWPISEDSPLTWFSPDPRGLLQVKDLHLSKSFEKFLKKTQFKIKFNTQPEKVIRNCAEVSRKHEEGTWITDEVVNAYLNFFAAGHVYTVEVYEGNVLIGGLYGVTINNYLSGESMFHLKTNASKMALYYLILIAKINQIPWIDTQMVTPVIESFGGQHLPRKSFIDLLNQQLLQENKRSHIFNYSQQKLDQL